MDGVARDQVENEAWNGYEQEVVMVMVMVRQACLFNVLKLLKMKCLKIGVPSRDRLPFFFPVAWWQAASPACTMHATVRLPAHCLHRPFPRRLPE